MLITSGQKRERSASQQPYCSRASVRISSLTEPRKPGRPAVTTPANIPMENAATVLAMAKSGPMIPPVTSIMLGSVTGDETQNAMMGARGTPRRRREAIRGKDAKATYGRYCSYQARDQNRAQGPALEPGECAVRPVAQSQRSGKQRRDGKHRQDFENAPTDIADHICVGVGDEGAGQKEGPG